MDAEPPALTAYTADATDRGCQPGTEGIFGTFMLLQEKWVLFILHALQPGPLGFNDIRRSASKVNTTTLSQRLDLLERAGLVTRTVERDMPPKTSYALTESGAALAGEVIGAIRRWSSRHLPGPATTALESVRQAELEP